MPNEIFFFFSSPRRERERRRIEFNDSSVESEESTSRDSRFASLRSILADNSGER
jgi:hypothetical protein